MYCKKVINDKLIREDIIKVIFYFIKWLNPTIYKKLFSMSRRVIFGLKASGFFSGEQR